MNNLEKIVLLSWYADENIDFVLKNNQKKYTQEERAGVDDDKVHKKNDLYDIKTVQGLIEYIDQCDISDLKIYSKHTHIHQGSLNPEILIVNDFPNSKRRISPIIYWLKIVRSCWLRCLGRLMLNLRKTR